MSNGFVPSDEVRSFFASFLSDEKPSSPRSAVSDEARAEAARQLEAVRARDAARRSTLSDYDLALERAKRMACSPIESRMLECLLGFGPVEARHIDAGEVTTLVAVVASIEIHAQYSIGSYFADIAIIGSRRTVIECDGREFHDRTGGQADHDRKRDRFMVGAGWTVLRYSGAEIHANVHHCASEAWRIAWGS